MTCWAAAEIANPPVSTYTRLVNTKSFDCGNCEPPVRNPSQLQSNRTYGPIGLSGFWAVDQTGATVSGCDGVVEDDGTCISFPLQFQIRPGSSTSQYALTANRAGVPIWTYFEPGFATLEVRQVVAVVSGNAYASYDADADGNGIAATRRVVALDKATGAFRWRQPDVTALAPLVSAQASLSVMGTR